MIPLRSQSRHAITPWVTWTIMLACTGVLVRLAMLDDTHARELMHALAVVPARIVIDPLGQALTLVTAQFLHAGWIHLAGNMLYLAVFGPAVEARLGRTAYLGLYLACGIVAAASFAWLHPDSATPLVGASGAIAAVLGAHLVLEPRTKVTTLIPAIVIFEVAALPAGFVIAVWFLLQAASSIAPVAGGTDTVAWTAHITGFLAGVMMATPAAVNDRMKRRRRSSVSTARRPTRKR